MSRTQLNTQIYHELRRELARIPKRQPGANGETQREETFADYNRRYGVRRGSYYRWEGAQQGTRRIDAGHARKAGFWQPIIEQIFKIQVELSDFEIGRWCPSEIALQEAQRRGIVQKSESGKRKAEIQVALFATTEPPFYPPTEVEGDQTGTPLSPPVNGGRFELSVRYYNLLVKKLGLKKARGITRFQAEYSNQVHQFDLTGSPYLEVVKAEGDDYLIRRRSPRARLSKEQKRDGLRLWIAGIVDDFSGLAALKYVVHRGESAALCRQFLMDAWCGLDAELPLRGLPEIIYCDNGSFSKTEETQNFLSQEMGVAVELKTHEAYRARSTGKIERNWRSVKGNFETSFLSGKEYWLLSELNAMLVKWCVRQGEARHRMLPMTKCEAYLKNLRGEVRIPADDALRNAFRTFERTVDGSGVFRLDNIFYRLPAEMRAQRILVYRNAAGEVVAECPLTGARVAAEVYEGPQAFGEFESFRETEMERTAKRREEGEWGESEHYLRTPLSSPREQGERADIVPFIAQEKEESKPTPFSAGAHFKDEIEAKGWVARELGIALLTFRKDYPQRWAELSELLGRTLSREEITQWASGIGAELRKAAGGGE